MRAVKRPYINIFYKLPKHEGVYLLTDTVSGKKYIGSSTNVQQRAHQHRNNQFRGVSFAYLGKFKDIDRLKIKVELLQDCKGFNRTDLLEAEASWILKLNTLHPNGLNSKTPNANG